MLTRKEFIKRFNLTKTNTKVLFSDGLSRKSRTLYVNHRGEFYAFYNNDMHIIRIPKNTSYIENMEEVEGILGAGYSWYH